MRYQKFKLFNILLFQSVFKVTADWRISELITSRLLTDVQKEEAHYSQPKKSAVSCSSIISRKPGLRLAQSQPTGIMKTIKEVKNWPSILSGHCLSKEFVLITELMLSEMLIC